MTEKIKGIKKAVGNFNQIRNAAIIYYDSSDKSVWCNEYVDGNSWTNYNSKTIYTILSKASKHNHTTMAEIKQLINQLPEKIKYSGEYPTQML